MKSKAILEWEDKVLNKYYIKYGVLSLSESERKTILDWMTSPDGIRYESRIIRLTVPMVLSLANKWAHGLQKKFQFNDETKFDIKPVIDAGKYHWVELRTAEAYIREGFKMRHCVSNYAAKPYCSIFSLRDAHNAPHCTVEAEEGFHDPSTGTVVYRISQIAGKMNRPVPKKYRVAVITLLNFFLKQGYTIAPKVYLTHSLIMKDQALIDVSTLKDVEGDLDLSFFTGEMPSCLNVSGNLLLNHAIPRKFSKELKVDGTVFTTGSFSVPSAWNKNTFKEQDALLAMMTKQPLFNLIK